MPGITEVVYTEYLKPHMLKIGIVFLIIIFSIASYYAYNTYFIKAKPTVFNDVANAQRVNKEANIAFFYADWCKFCKDAKQPWEEFSNKYNNTEVNGYMIICSAINMSTADNPNDPNHPLIAEFNIKGYPTVKMTYDGKTVDYDAKISYPSLVKYVNTIK